MLFTVLVFISKMVSVNYERQISKNVKVIILGGAIMLVHEMIANQGSVNGICCDRLQ